MTTVDPIDCDAFGDKLPLYVGGDLDADVLAACDAHLADCAACRSALERARRARQTYFEVSHAAVARDLEELQLDLWPAVRDELRRDGPLAPTEERGAPSQPLALGLPSETEAATPERAPAGSRFALLRGGLLTAAAALVAVFAWPSAPDGDTPGGSGEGTPAVAVSDEGLLPDQTEGSPAIENGLPGSNGIDPGILAQPDTGVGAQGGGLQPVHFGDSLLYETLLNEMRQQNVPGLMPDPDRLASQVGVPLR